MIGSHLAKSSSSRSRKANTASQSTSPQAFGFSPAMRSATATARAGVKHAIAALGLADVAGQAAVGFHGLERPHDVGDGQAEPASVEHADKRPCPAAAQAGCGFGLSL